MPNMRSYSRSFAGGEISPEMFGRIDDAKFQSGAAKLLNFIVNPTGAAKNRAGFAYVNATKNNGVARLIPFTYSLGQTLVVEVGAGYFRFHTQGATVLASLTSGGTTAYLTVRQPGYRPGLGGGSTSAAVFYGVFSGSVENGSPVILTGTLPAGLTAGTTYYVVGLFPPSYNPPPNGTPPGFSVAATPGGPAIEISDPNSYSVKATFNNIYSVGNVAAVDLGNGTSQVYYCIQGGTGLSVTDPTHFTLMGTYPNDAIPYEVPNSYSAADLFDIHYAQSADVMTLVHANYPPMELARLGAGMWTLSPINFGPPLTAPANLAAAASPGFVAKISSISTADPALITTASNHTLAQGDGVYLDNLTATIGGVPTPLDGFYMVSGVPADSSGNLIDNELTLMDYSGNALDSTGWSGYAATDPSKPITLQYGTKIFNITNSYAVQAIAADGVSTSELTDAVSVTNNLDVPGAYNTVSWDASADAQSYNVYKQFNGLWGYIGNTEATNFVDDNIAPDMSITPGISDAVFTSPGNYPRTVGYFQQRRCFASTDSSPLNVWMSNSGTESMFDYSLPSLATDRIAFRVASLTADAIQHLVPMMQLMLLTGSAEFTLYPVTSDVITPSSIDVKPQTYVGASNVMPTLVNTTLVYAAARGGHVRELGYAWTVNGFMTGDLSLRAAHLFDGFTIVDQAYSKAPWPILWFVSSSGKLLGLTYIPEEQVGAWHQHDTEGSFESVACVAEGNEDVLYAVINRTVNGQTVRYVERMQSRMIDPADASTWFFVDAGIKQTFSDPVTTLSGLTWLEGCTVSVLADGGVQSPKVVTGGAITLDHAAKTVIVGLPYTMDLQTLPMVLQLDGYGQGRSKNINKAWVKVYQSSGVLVGPDENTLTEIKQRTTEPWGSPPALQTAELFVLTTPSWQQSGQALIRQRNPLPLDVVGLTLEVAIGG